MRATTTCLIAHDRNKYSVDAKAAGRAVLVRVYADRIVALLGEEIVADHPRSFKRDQVVYEACAEALEAGVANGDVVVAILARNRQPPAPPSITTPEALKLKAEPVADCARYDNLRKRREDALWSVIRSSTP